MKFPEICPVCHKGPIVPLFEEYSILARKGPEQKLVGGLSAFQCTQELHIFFLMTRDVEEFLMTRAAEERRRAIDVS